ncbi:hypothetical protein IHQ68_08050 [Chelatococcus sambhunathii]|uniref:DUF3168 domain-containing protein n=1 Tax=Chelatococcus sambhunathii TaxID=363953 RepID=A0ABU1DEN4_9HYPH|nr:hypothetical protein [Chelatococcus sambhunathii]MDR4306567.1 hypothetical protein [Chelatococcus sambhunathii]
MTVITDAFEQHLLSRLTTSQDVTAVVIAENIALEDGLPHTNAEVIIAKAVDVTDTRADTDLIECDIHVFTRALNGPAPTAIVNAINSNLRTIPIAPASRRYLRGIIWPADYVEARHAVIHLQAWVLK